MGISRPIQSMLAGNSFCNLKGFSTSTKWKTLPLVPLWGSAECCTAWVPSVLSRLSGSSFQWASEDRATLCQKKWMKASELLLKWLRKADWRSLGLRWNCSTTLILHQKCVWKEKYLSCLKQVRLIIFLKCAIKFLARVLFHAQGYKNIINL